jgi:hypothetical protein
MFKMLSVITEDQLVKGVAESWRRQYYNNGKWSDGRAKAIYQQLLAKKPTTDEEVAAIIGNHSWSSTLCSCCHEYATQVLVCRDDDYESNSTLCIPCLTKALNEAGYKLTKET